MASSSQYNPPVASHSHHCLPWRGGELEFCLKSESTVGAGRPHMLVEFTLSFSVKFAIPSLVEGGSYHFASYITTNRCCRIAVDNPSQYFSMPNVSNKITALLIGAGCPVHAEVFRLLAPYVSRLADATIKSAEVRSHTAMKVSANGICMLRVDLNMVENIVNWSRAFCSSNEQESLGTCAVCLDEIWKERIWPVTLVCSHVFHLKCIALWLQKQNSCPLCRSKQPIIIDD